MLVTGGYALSRNTFADFGKRYNAQGFITFNNRELTPKQKAKIITGSLVGTALPMLLILKNQKVPPQKIAYGIKEMILLSTGSIAGGVIGGYFADKETSFMKKMHEGIFQFFNAVIPTLLISPILKLCSKIKPLQNNKIKAAALLGGIFGGMCAGEKISNGLTKNMKGKEQRKLKFVDLISNIDVISGAMIMAKFPIIGRLGVEKFLPFVYLWTGYQSGRKM